MENFLFTGAIGIPGAVVGILIGGFILKRFQLKPKGIQCDLRGGQHIAECSRTLDPDIPPTA